jgi:hypothetical protein
MGLGTAGVLTAVSMGASLAGTGMSIAQAAKQNQLAKSAAADAEKAMAEAKKELEKNYYAQLGIAKEPYELQREALLSSGAQAMLAGAESQRGAAATAGRVLMAQNANQQAVTANMSQDINNINKLIAGEDARLAGARANLDLAEVKGAQQARQDAIAARNQSIASAIGGLSGAAKTGLDQYNKMYVNDKTAAKGNTTSTAAVTSPSEMARTPQYITDVNAAAIQQGIDSQAYLNKAYSNPELMIDQGNGMGYNPEISAIKYGINAQPNGSMLANSGMSSSSPFMPANNPLGMPATDVIPSAVSAQYNTSINPFMMSTPNQRPFGYGEAWGPINYSVGPWQYANVGLPSIDVMMNRSNNPNAWTPPAELPYVSDTYGGLQGISGTTSYYDPNVMGYQSPW